MIDTRNSGSMIQYRLQWTNIAGIWNSSSITKMKQRTLLVSGQLIEPACHQVVDYPIIRNDEIITPARRLTSVDLGSRAVSRRVFVLDANRLNAHVPAQAPAALNSTH